MRTARIFAPLPDGRGVSLWKGIALAAVLLAGATFPAPAQHTSPVAHAAATKALNWLKAQQRGDGSVGDLGQTAELVLAIAVAGGDPNGWSPSPVAFLQSKSQAAIDAGAGVLGKVILAVKAARKDPRAFGGRNLVTALKGMEVAGKFGVFFPDHAFAMLGLAAAGEAVPAGAVAHVLGGQGPDGGWGLTGTPVDPFLSDTNDTALAVQALATAGVTPVLPSVAISRAHLFLLASQADDAGWPYQRVGAFCPGLCASDPNSTAYVLQALAASSVDADKDWKKGTTTPVQALMAMQNANGSFKTCEGCSLLFATLQAVPGLFAKPMLSIAAG